MGKDKDGQALLPINTNDERYVAQANEFVEGRQNLKLNSAKIMRAVIMQINLRLETLSISLMAVSITRALNWLIFLYLF